MKRLAGHQTYFFPYIGFFTVLNSSDIFIYGDELQYEKKSWMNRNRIIGEDGKIRYFTVPLKKAKIKTPTNKMEICYHKDWQQDILNQLGYYKKRAPYYDDVVEMLKCLFAQKHHYLSELAIDSVDVTLQKLGIKEKKIIKMSELELNPPENIVADEWGLYMCEYFKDEHIDTFINAPGGKGFYDVSKYEAHGIKTEFLQNNLRPYDQGLDVFAEGLSIIDVLMFNSTEEVRDMINDYHLI
ncbi:MAG: hypothetical protein E7307_02430 [Butyrivibrio sp.]|nr:hypothetical protein [Butyrivibrio sp.]